MKRDIQIAKWLNIAFLIILILFTTFSSGMIYGMYHVLYGSGS